MTGADGPYDPDDPDGYKRQGALYAEWARAAGVNTGPNTTATIPVLVCQRCGHQWIPRVPAPKKCPDCQSRAWGLPDEH